MRQLRLVAPVAGLLAAAFLAQAQPPAYPPGELDRLVARIALYPDSLVAQILAAATFPDQIPDAARWADEHHYLVGEELAEAIERDRLPWDPSVQALLPFPSVLEMMASDPAWTGELGNAFLAQQPDVVDAVQRERRRAYDYGYLRTNPQFVVNYGPYIEIVPARPGIIYVPYYDPLVIYAAPRPDFFVGSAIRFNFGITIGAAFRPWGWGANRVVWNTRTVIVNDAPWRRTWVNRHTYVHPYTVQRYVPERRVEEHELHDRTPREREAYHTGRERVEDHPRGRDQDRGRPRSNSRNR